MITREQLEYAVIIFEHLYNYKYMRDAGYKNTQKLYTRNGREISELDVCAPSPNPHDHRYDGYKSVFPVKSNGTKFGFEIDKEVFKKLNLEECFFVVYYKENERFISNSYFSPGPFTRIDDREFNYLINQIAL